MFLRARRSLLGFASLAVASLPVVGVGCGAAPGDDTGETSAAVTNPNDKAAFDFFRAKGLTAVQAAGVVGNLDQESGVDPDAVEPGGPGRGIAQWSAGGRWDTEAKDNAEWYARTLGLNVDSLQLQLDFIWYELTTYPGFGLAALRAATTVSAATIAFQTDFEACGTCEQSQRISYAEAVLSAFGSDAVDGGAATISPTSCTVTTTGATGQCVDTSQCASQGGKSTPGFCPGAANIECCTGVGSSGSSTRVWLGERSPRAAPGDGQRNGDGLDGRRLFLDHAGQGDAEQRVRQELQQWRLVPVRQRRMDRSLDRPDHLQRHLSALEAWCLSPIPSRSRRRPTSKYKSYVSVGLLALARSRRNPPDFYGWTPVFSGRRAKANRLRRALPSRGCTTPPRPEKAWAFGVLAHAGFAFGDAYSVLSPGLSARSFSRRPSPRRTDDPRCPPALPRSPPGLSPRATRRPR